MAYSSILGAEPAPALPTGRDAGMLGPSDNSDSGSDTIGTHEAHADSDSVGTGERGSVEADDREGGDILPDRVVRMGEGTDLVDDVADADEFTDLDAGDASAELDPDAPAGTETL
ncbi:hypothetical protein [Caenimonas aquaedulcis]|uniref:Chemotaxis protein n=1 Tax=Caenimonas aquaedulcis TaxID=2793270 RepID=A0A931H519_9BURK|nr:hypothetical protein [Caenimonas aquaedulcis]MBG9388598.1 hypothetical protein [Caenimonas aquaedulcis]